MAIPLNEDWRALFHQYADEHRDPVNQACHSVGIPLILASIPAAVSVVGLPLAAGLFSVGWTFQFVGHVFEGRKPSFVEDRRFLAVGALWWLAKRGVKFEGVDVESLAAAA